MAKIVQKGLWISIKSLDKESRKNYLTSMVLFFISSLAWGIHIASVGGIDNNPDYCQSRQQRQYVCPMREN